MYAEETELYYLRKRFFSSVTLRFLNADNIQFGQNTYCYCENDPVSRCDPTGNRSVDATTPWNSRFSYTMYPPGAGGGATILAGISAIGRLISEPVTAEQIITNSWTAIVNTLIAAGDWLYRRLLTQEQVFDDEVIEAITALPEYAALEKALVRAKCKGEQSDKVPKCNTNKHHIIAQSAGIANPAYKIWTEDCHMDIHDDENLVRVSTKMHWFMHQTVYYTSVNDLVRKASQLSIGTLETNVRCAVYLIKNLILTVDQTIP